MPLPRRSKISSAFIPELYSELCDKPFAHSSCSQSLSSATTSTPPCKNGLGLEKRCLEKCSKRGLKSGKYIGPIVGRGKSARGADPRGGCSAQPHAWNAFGGDPPSGCVARLHGKGEEWVNLFWGCQWDPSACRSGRRVVPAMGGPATPPS